MISRGLVNLALRVGALRVRVGALRLHVGESGAASWCAAAWCAAGKQIVKFRKVSTVFAIFK